MNELLLLLLLQEREREREGGEMVVAFSFNDHMRVSE